MTTPILLTVLLLLIGSVGGFERGAPITLCYDPYPHHHGVFASLEPSPYNITVKPTSYKPSDVITATVSGTRRITGLAVSAKSTTGDWSYNYGTFVQIPDNLQAYKYYSNDSNCVTHKGKLPESTRKVEMRWKAPNKSIGNIIFSATIIYDFETYWVNHTAVLTSDDPITEQPISAIKTTSTFDSDLELTKCGDKNGCVKYPARCTGSSCRHYITYKIMGDHVRFRLMSTGVTTSSFFMSLGISEDVWMENDETLTCMENENDEFVFKQGFNPGYHNSAVLKTKVHDYIANLVDGVMMCEFTRPLTSPFTLMAQKPETKPGDIHDGVSTAKYHLYLGWGELYKGAHSNMQKHQHIPIVSKEKIALKEKKSHDFYALNDSVKVHATFMVVAWFGTAAIAMIIARFFRAGIIREDQKLGGLAAWFQVHRGLVFSSIILSSAAFILIFTHYQKWTEAENLHAAFGISVMSLMFIQVLAAFCRPDPDSSKRTVFNWIHRILGMLTYGLATATMFIGTRMVYMPKELMSTGTYILIALVSVHMLFIIVFQLMKCCEGSSQPVKLSNINGVEMKNVNSNPSNDDVPLKSAGHSTVKSALLFVFIVLVAALLAAFLTILWIH